MTNAVSQTRLLLVALIALLAAGNGWTQPAAVDVTAGSAVTLSDALWYWAPPAEHDWSAPPGPANFQPLRHQAMPPGITRLWLWFRLTNTDSVPRERILSLEELLFERLRLRAPQADGSWLTAASGLTVPREQWPLGYRYPAFLLDVLPGTHDYYLAVESRHWPLLAPRVMDLPHLTAHLDRGGHTAHILALGTQLGLLVLALATALRGGQHPALRAFTAFLLASFLLSLFMGGELLRWLDRHNSQLGGYLIAATGITALWLTRSLFQTRRHTLRLDRALGAIMLAFVLVGLAQLFLPPSLFVCQASLGLIAAFSMMATGVVYWRRHHPSGRLYTLAVSGYQLLMLPGFLGGAGLIPYNYWARHGHEFAAIVMALLFALAISGNLRALRQRQEQLERRAIQADERNRAKSELLARISHEVRTPINGVLGMTDVLAQTPLSLGQHRYLEVINSSGQLLLEIVNDLLDYAKIEADGIELEHIPFALDGLLTQCMAVFLPEAHEKGLTFTVAIRPETPLALLGDPTRLQQIFNNLISNAVKFSERGNIRIDVQGTPRGEQKTELTISVRDRGIGMEPKQIQRLFQPFSQADDSTTRRYGGTGLGLSISRQLARLMDGDIEVQSAPGRGTTLAVRVMLEVNEPVERRLQQQRSLLAGHSMLLVYDHPSYGDAMAYYFLSWGMTVHRASRREEVQQILAHQSVELVFVSSGPVLADRGLIEVLAESGPPVVVLQAMFDPSVQELLEGSPARYLVAPCTITDIAEILCETLGLIGEGSIEPLEATQLPHDRAQVLVVEDNPVNRQVMAALLARLGVTCSFAEDGARAVERYQQEHERYQLVLMDCEMPVMNGYDATRHIRRFERAHDLPRKPVVAVTAHALADSDARCLAAGMDEVLNKPVSMQMLGELLGRVSDQEPRLPPP